MTSLSGCALSPVTEDVPKRELTLISMSSSYLQIAVTLSLMYLFQTTIPNALADISHALDLLPVDSSASPATRQKVRDELDTWREHLRDVHAKIDSIENAWQQEPEESEDNTLPDAEGGEVIQIMDRYASAHKLIDRYLNNEQTKEAIMRVDRIMLSAAEAPGRHCISIPQFLAYISQQPKSASDREDAAFLNLLKGYAYVGYGEFASLMIFIITQTDWL